MLDIPDVIFHKAPINQMQDLVVINIHIELAALAGGAAYAFVPAKPFPAFCPGKVELRMLKVMSPIQPYCTYFAIRQKNCCGKSMTVIRIRIAVNEPGICPVFAFIK